MVKHTMVGRLVYGYFADAFITCSIFEQIAQKICIYQIKAVPLHRFLLFIFFFFINRLSSDALRSDCVGCFIVYLAKKIVNFTKNQLFFEKIVEKICVYQKIVVPLHSKNKQNNTKQ